MAALANDGAPQQFFGKLEHSSPLVEKWFREARAPASPPDEPLRRIVIEACIVNHNTSPFAELALRSLMATSRDAELEVTVVDNHSTDDGLSALRAAADSHSARFLESRWPSPRSRVNSHGDVLRDFVLSLADAELLLFVDADVVFTTPGTVVTMRTELDRAPDLWAVQARFVWAEDHFGPGGSLDVSAGTPLDVRTEVLMGRTTFRNEFSGRFQPRCHPGCTLVRCSPVFRAVVKHVGLAPAIVISPDENRAGVHDTFALASSAMASHGLRYALSSATVLHFFGVSYEGAHDVPQKSRECERLLAKVRNASPTLPSWYSD